MRHKCAATCWRPRRTLLQGWPRPRGTFLKLRGSGAAHDALDGRRCPAGCCQVQRRRGRMAAAAAGWAEPALGPPASPGAEACRTRLARHWLNAVRSIDKSGYSELWSTVTLLTTAARLCHCAWLRRWRRRGSRRRDQGGGVGWVGGRLLSRESMRGLDDELYEGARAR
jgi:hypothetical protein